MSHPSTVLTRPPVHGGRLGLVEPAAFEGDCPSCAGVFEVNDAGQVPEHTRSDRADRRRCPCSGWLARDVRPRPYHHVEGVRWL